VVKETLENPESDHHAVTPMTDSRSSACLPERRRGLSHRADAEVNEWRQA